MEQTLLLIKPNVVEDHKIGKVISLLEEKGLLIKDIKMEVMTRERAEGFYDIHKGRPFFHPLVDFMTSGPIVEMVLEREDCVQYVRSVVGDTDPQKAAEGTIRRLYGRSITQNAVHASDSIENALKEIQYIFSECG